MTRFSPYAVGAIRMVPNLRGRMLGLAGVVCLLMASSAPRLSAAPLVGQFGRVVNTPFSGEIVVVNKLPIKQLNKVQIQPAAPKQTAINIKPALDQAWLRVQPVLTKLAQQELPKRGKKGFNPHHIRLSFARQPALFGGWDGAGFTLKSVLRGNSITLKLTTPDVKVGPVKIGAPRGLDPEITVPIDAELTVDVTPGLREMKVGPANLKLFAGKPRGNNLTGDIALVVNDAIAFLGGPNFVNMVRQEINKQGGNVAAPVKVELTKLLPALGKVASPNAAIRSYFQGNRLILEVYEAQPVIVR